MKKNYTIERTLVREQDRSAATGAKKGDIKRHCSLGVIEKNTKFEKNWKNQSLCQC